MHITKVWFDDSNIYAVTDSGHTIGNPLSWFPRLKNASTEQRANYEIGHYGVHWEQLDEDLSLEGFLTYKWETPVLHAER